jgi:hypothetical protein
MIRSWSLIVTIEFDESQPSAINSKPLSLPVLMGEPTGSSVEMSVTNSFQLRMKPSRSWAFHVS